MQGTGFASKNSLPLNKPGQQRIAWNGVQRNEDYKRMAGRKYLWNTDRSFSIKAKKSLLIKNR
jgi:hypothetical protein